MCMTGHRLYLVLLLALTACRHASGVSTDPDALIGWGGDTFSHSDVFGADGDSQRWVETLSWHPRAFLFHNFLSPAETNQLIVEAAPSLKRSTVVGSDEDSSAVDEIRTSYGTFLDRLSSPVVELLEKKLANWTQMPIVHQEDVQILRYQYGQKYGAHYDSLGRVCTVLVYLTDVEEGGETAFPKTTDANWADPQQASAGEEYSECAQGHVAAKPKKGDALLFYSMKPDGKTTDPLAMHTGCPLLKGIKWTATIWMHPTPFRPDDFHRVYKNKKETGVHAKLLPREDDPGVCIDVEEKCGEWAEEGECEKNSGFMTGRGTDSAGACRKSCKVCTVCADADLACYKKNRESAGYLHLVDEVRQITGRDLPAQF